VLLLVLCFAAGFAAWQFKSLSDLIVYRLEKRIVQTLTQVVTTPSGDSVTVTTTRGTDETVAAFYARHKAAVDHIKANG
jgi:hypothetical protein